MLKQLLKSTFIVSFLTMISRIFGLIRDVVIANLFGAGIASDAFFVAFRISNYMRRLFAEGGFAKVFVPVLVEYKARRDIGGVKDLIDHVSGKLALILFCITVIGVIFAPIWIIFFAPGFLQHTDKMQLSVDMLRITFPYIFFISLTAFASGILNTYGNFAVPAFTPVILNITLIICAVFLAPYLQQPVTALAWGVLIAGGLQLFFQIPFLIRIDRLPRSKIKKDHAGVGKILRLMIPTLFAASIAQINLIIDMLMASFLITGSISWLYYSDRLMTFPLGVFGVALATVILPKLSEKHIQGDISNFSNILDWALKWVMLISIPAAIGLISLAEVVLTTIFQHGEFTAFHVEKTRQSLVVYAIGLPCFIANKVLTSAYFSRQDTKTPVKTAFFAMFANIILNLALIGYLAHAGLALATSLAALLDMTLLFYFLKRKKIYSPYATVWVIFFLRVVFATFVMGVLLYYISSIVEAAWVQLDVFSNVLKLCAYIIIGIISYFSVLWLTGLRRETLLLPTQSY